MSAPGNIQRAAVGSRRDWQTPRPVFEDLAGIAGFWPEIDAAASAENRLCDLWIGEEEDAFTHRDLCGRSFWLNPPYGRDPGRAGPTLGDWAALTLEWQISGSSGIVLVPCAPDRAWWRSWFLDADEVLLADARISFVDPETGRPQPGNTVASSAFILRPVRWVAQAEDRPALMTGLSTPRVLLWELPGGRPRKRK